MNQFNYEQRRKHFGTDNGDISLTETFLVLMRTIT